MEWEEYEGTVKEIYQALGSSHGVVIECYGRECKRIALSGVEHQIDILASHSDGVHTYHTAIECKYWNEKVNKDAIMKVESIVRDLRLHQGVVVSKRGFTPDAISYAQHVNVKLVELAEYKGYLKDNKFTKLYTNLVVTTTKLQDVVFLCEQDTIDTSRFKSFMTSVNDLVVHRNDGSTERFSDLVVAFLNSTVLPSDFGEIESYEVRFKDPTVIENVKNTQAIVVVGVRFNGYKISYTVLDPDYHTSNGWLRMRLLFEKKELVYSLFGDLRDIDHPRIELEAFPGHEHKLEFVLRKKVFSVSEI